MYLSGKKFVQTFFWMGEHPQASRSLLHFSGRHLCLFSGAPTFVWPNNLIRSVRSCDKICTESWLGRVALSFLLCLCLENHLCPCLFLSPSAAVVLLFLVWPVGLNPGAPFLAPAPRSDEFLFLLGCPLLLERKDTFPGYLLRPSP